LLRARDVALAEAPEKTVAAFAVAAKLELVLRDCYRNDAARALVTTHVSYEYL
jgi:hypothetical protein